MDCIIDCKCYKITKKRNPDKLHVIINNAKLPKSKIIKQTMQLIRKDKYG